MIRKGSLVQIDAEKVQDHPVYRTVTDKRWKVKNVENGMANVGDGVMLPLVILKGIPQKKGKRLAA